MDSLSLADMEEYNFAYDHWLKVARNEFTRGQIVETAKDNMDMCSPIWNAMQDELAHRDKLLLANSLRDSPNLASNQDSQLTRFGVFLLRCRQAHRAAWYLISFAHCSS